MKNRKSLLLRWWIIFMTINVATVFLCLTGVTSIVNSADITKISFLIYSLFYIFMVRHGIILYKFSKKKFIEQQDIYENHHKNESGWFASDLLLNLGIIGTVAGLIYMFYLLGVTFVEADAFTTINIKSSVLKMGIGISTALYTTIVGLICSTILKIQLFNFTNYLNKISENFGYTK